MSHHSLQCFQKLCTSLENVLQQFGTVEQLLKQLLMLLELMQMLRFQKPPNKPMHRSSSKLIVETLLGQQQQKQALRQAKMLMVVVAMLQ